MLLGARSTWGFFFGAFVSLALGCGDDGAGGAGAQGGAGGAAAGGHGGEVAAGAASNGGAGGGGCGAVPFIEGAACDACAADHCCDVMEACDKDEVCRGVSACIRACDPADHACFQACVADAPSVPPAWYAVRECVATSCKADCDYDALTCGGVAAVNLACDSCIVSSCCDAAKAKNDEPDSFAFLGCVATCAGGDGDVGACTSACVDAHPTGVALTDAFSACQVDNCHDECFTGTCAGPATIGSVACAACLSGSCCDQGLACGTTATCAYATVPCVLACAGGDPACVGACLADAGPAAPIAGAYFVCAAAECNAECFPALTFACGNAFALEDATCKTCLETDCCTAGTTCGEDAECFALMTCVEGCADETCAQSCKAQHPAASAKYAELDTCRTTTCASACGGY
ncbi:MAG: hypothetical protein U0271_08330 [Polyangiaceae bacterium]